MTGPSEDDFSSEVLIDASVDATIPLQTNTAESEEILRENLQKRKIQLLRSQSGSTPKRIKKEPLPGESFVTDCPHLSLNVDKVVKKLKDPATWVCEQCGTTESVWICLSCGYTGCGRYVKKHATNHATAHNHSITFSINSKICHCYVCDQGVFNQDVKGELQLVRDTLDQIQSQRSFSSLTRHGSVYRQGENFDAVPKVAGQGFELPTYHDKLYTASKFSSLRILSRVFNAWVSSRKDDSVELRSDLAVEATPSSTQQDASLPQQDHGVSVSNEPIPMVCLSPAAPVIQSSERRSRRPLLLPGHTGLRNLGNTCFLNSVFQALSNLSVFREFFLLHWPTDIVKTNEPVKPETNKSRRASRRLSMQSDTASSPIDSEENQEGIVTYPQLFRQPTEALVESMGSGHESSAREVKRKMEQLSRDLKKVDVNGISLSLEVQNLLRVLWSGKTAVVSPYALLACVWRLAPNYAGYKQHDAQDFFYFMHNHLEEEFKKIKKSSESLRISPSVLSLPPHSSFHGELISEIRCEKCNNVSTQANPFMDLSVDIPERPIKSEPGSPASSTRKSNQVAEAMASEECSDMQVDVAVDVAAGDVTVMVDEQSPPDSSTLVEPTSPPSNMLINSSQESNSTDVVMSVLIEQTNDLDLDSTQTSAGSTAVSTTTTADNEVPESEEQDVMTVVDVSRVNDDPTPEPTVKRRSNRVAKIEEQKRQVELAQPRADKEASKTANSKRQTRTRQKDAAGKTVKSEETEEKESNRTRRKRPQRSKEPVTTSRKRIKQEQAPQKRKNAKTAKKNENNNTKKTKEKRATETKRSTAKDSTEESGSEEDSSENDDPLDDPSVPRGTGGRLSSYRPELSDCLDSFTSSELLDGFKCEKCGRNSTSKKQMLISKLPSVLCLHIKRWRTVFTGSGKAFRSHRVKVGTKVGFPLENLDMSRYLHPKELVNPRVDSTDEVKNGMESIENTRESFLYDLSSVIVHHGKAEEQGHYTTYSKDPHSDRWILYNDAIIQFVSASEVANAQAYMLFYQRKIAANNLTTTT